MNRFHLASALLVFLAAAHGETTPSPYAGQESREIKSLSASDIAGLLAGKGMGYAKAAELNGYPGPVHVLQLSSELGLSAEQQAETEAIFSRMEALAKDLGAQLVEAERTLDLAFHDHTVRADTLSQQLDRLARINGKLRDVHLQAHLQQARVLSPDQIAAYNELRGYGHTDRINPAQHPAHAKHPATGAQNGKEDMNSVAQGQFEVSITPQDELKTPQGIRLGRSTLEKEFTGDFQGSGKGEMLTGLTPVNGSAGYVAMEHVSGSLTGREGSFILQHSGSMHGGEQALSIGIVPDSGTGELTGISGTLDIRIADGAHFYELNYTLPD